MANERKGGMGLLPRLIIGVFVPILLAFLVIGIMIFVSINVGSIQFKSVKDIGFSSLRELSAASLKESTVSLNKLGERIIQQKAEDVAKQVEVAMKSRGIKMGDLAKNALMQEIAVQKVGESGYTALLDNRAFTYLHPDPKVAGSNLHPLATKLPQFWKIIEASMQAPAFGYYDWKDPDGTIRPKYMYVAHVKGTDLRIAATTYIDEFSKPAKAIVEKMKNIEKTNSGQYNQRFQFFSVVVLLVLLLLLVVIYVYSYSIVRPIRHLSEIADKISMGDLKTTINVKAKGEVGVLVESIERMQTSVKAAIERLQKRRENGTAKRQQAM